MTEEVKDMTAQEVDTTQQATQETTAEKPVVASIPMVAETMVQEIAKNTVKQDLEIVRAKKEELIVAGETLFKDEIASLEEKEKALTVKIEAAAKETQTEAKTMTAGIMTIEKTFWEKYGNIILHTIEYVGMVVIICVLKGWL